MENIIYGEGFENYTPEVGVDFNLVFEEEGRTLTVHPFWDEDCGDVAGFNVYDEDGNHLGDCEDKWEIEEYL